LGEALLKLRANEKLKHGEWLLFLKEQGLKYQPVKKAMRIRRKHETLESCQQLTVEAALDYDEQRCLSEESDADEEALEMALVGGTGSAKPPPQKPVAQKKKRKAAAAQRPTGDQGPHAAPEKEATDEEMGHFLIFVTSVGNLQRAKVVFEQGVWQCEQVGGLDGMQGK